MMLYLNLHNETIVESFPKLFLSKVFITVTQKEPRHKLPLVCKIFLKHHTYSSEAQRYIVDVCTYLLIPTLSQDFNGNKQPSLYLTLTQEWLGNHKVTNSTLHHLKQYLSRYLVGCVSNLDFNEYDHCLEV